MSNRDYLLQSLLVVVMLVGLLATSEAATRNFDIGDRLSIRRLRSTSGAEESQTFAKPSVIILWSTWSPASQAALSEILASAPQGGTRWQLIPINVDGPSLTTSDTARVNPAARAAGWQGQVWHDSGYHLMDELGVFSIPTVIFTNLGGQIEEVEHDWSARIRQRLFTYYFGAATDSFPGITTPESTPQCRSKSESARRHWRSGNTELALTQMREVIDSCAGLPNDYARYADWIWSSGDSLGRGDEVTQSITSRDQNAWTLSARAGLARNNGDCSLSVSLCREALALDSAFFPAWILLAEASRACDDSTSMIQGYNRARALNRLDQRVLAMGAELAARRNEPEAAVRLMRAAVEAGLRRRRL